MWFSGGSGQKPRKTTVGGGGSKNPENRTTRFMDAPYACAASSGETVFNVEYDVAIHERLDQGPVLVEITRDPSDMLGFGLSKCPESYAVRNFEIQIV